MQFVTYAQNLEDVILWRALRDVSDGFYIDLGAADPELNSVTKAFYDRGWHGVNVEPGSRPFARLVMERPRDTNINAAVSRDSNTRKIYFVGDENELSTLDPNAAEEHRNSGFDVREAAIRCITLGEICAEHVKNKDIHFLKIDVEGSEPDALRGHDFSQWRPWIIIIEAHEPERVSRHWEESEGILFEFQYKFVYCDGLNRFYVDQERFDQLSRVFEVPPNTYDNWIKASEVEIQRRAKFSEDGRVEALQELIELKKKYSVLQSWENKIENKNDETVEAVNISKIELLDKSYLDLIQRFKITECERDAYMQEIFETNRYVGLLTGERQNNIENISKLTAEISKNQIEIQELQFSKTVIETQLKSVYYSTSWKISKPIRFVKFLLVNIRKQLGAM